ncbi:transglutaminase domain-containing protein [Brachybacterium sp. YJGR34]|uniref:transglutaminase domain-containing protein n=1 Tax=Brachybacterium sp. YJGR34 TaxID=2059911 RepID=UPI000E0B958C|nr:transglutaminase domain-containing protein [Brachybacterium sp. YJGR34]
MTATGATPTRPPSYFQGVPAARRTLDLLALGTLFVLGILGFHTVYGGVQYLLTGVMALAFGTLIALIGARWRWGPLRLTPLTIGVYLLFGAMFAAPTHAFFGILPSLGSLGEMLRAPVTSWKSVLTVAPPVGAAQGVLAVVWISVLLLSLLGMTVVLRTRRYVAAWLFPLALMVVSIVFGTDQAFWPVLRGVLYAIISVAWLTWRFEGARLAGAQSTIISDTVRPGSWKNPVLRRRVVGGAVIMAIALGAGVAAHALLAPPAGSLRFAARHHVVVPFDPREYVSPLTEFRGYLKDQREEEIFSISGVEGGDLVRLATMDYYDLHVYNVASSTKKDSASGAFLPTASGVTLHEPGEGAQVSTVTVGAYSGVWMPTLGERTNRLDVDGMAADRAGVTSENLFLNQQSQTAVTASGLRPGDTYELTYEPYTEPSGEQLRSAEFADITLPENLPIDELAPLAEEWAGSSDSDVERFQNLMRAIKDDAFYSHGLEDDSASLSGHGASRLLAMIEPVSFDEETPDAQPLGRIGDEEQYAAMTAVMARSIDIPARVVMGFEVPEGQEGTASITGEDVTAWVEVAFDDVGWVRFDPAPDEDEDPTEPTPKEEDKPLPQVAQPPPPPVEPPAPPPGAMSDDTEKEQDDLEETTSWAVYAAVGLIPLGLIGLALLTVVIAKAVRRGRRRTRGPLPARIDGGWQEILDLMADMGRAPDPLLTRAEQAALLEAEVPALGATALAGGADRAVFGPDDLPEAAVEEYWAQIGQARRGVAAAVPWHRRLRARFSLRSFRWRAAERRQDRKRARANRRARDRAQQHADALRRRRSGTRGGRSGSSTRRKGR